MALFELTRKKGHELRIRPIEINGFGSLFRKPFTGELGLDRPSDHEPVGDASDGSDQVDPIKTLVT